MRTRFSLIVIGFALTLVAVGCQVLAGITVLDGTSAGGGGGGSDRGDAGDAGDASETGDGDAAQPQCTTATVETDCGTSSTCHGFTCVEGQCVPNNADAGTICGSDAVTTCDPQHTCDGQGTCLPRYAESGTTCGDACSDYIATTGTCDGQGNCDTTMKSCVAYACNATTKACNTSCTQPSDCNSTALCATMPGLCVMCGTVPLNETCTVSTQCDSCDGETCVTTCESGDCMGDITLNDSTGPTRLDCNGQCNDITVTCQGAGGCEITCGAGGCTNLMVMCDQNGPCTLSCTDPTACAGASVTCGNNTCTATCTSAVTIDQNCEASCNCAKKGCQ